MTKRITLKNLEQTNNTGAWLYRRGTKYEIFEYDPCCLWCNTTGGLFKTCESETVLIEIP